jgi:arsenate reductase
MFYNNSTKTEDFFQKALKDVELSDDRKSLLLNISGFIVDELKSNRTVHLNFICTHNSRRSQLAQVWAHYAIDYFQLNNINSFSGGTETTAFFSNTVKTLQEVGFEFHIKDFSHQNPIYEISFKKMNTKILGFSKVYNDPMNEQPFMAITTCSNADENCPFISEAVKRFHLPFTDPKIADNTPNALEIYKKTSKLIAGEIGFLIQNVRNQLI